jgi:DNA-binding MarR family transcriptional regulator
VTDRLPVTGQVIGEAQRAIEPLLGTVLAEVGIDFPTWVTINTLATGGGAHPRAAVERDLVERLREDPPAIHDLLERTAAAGLVEPGDGTGDAEVRLTGQGTNVHQRVREGIARTSSRLYAGLDPGDLATTREVLVEVTRRARTLLAS